MPTIEITSEAMDYLRGLAEPFVDTPATVLDRIIAEHKAGVGAVKFETESGKSDKRPIYKTEHLPDLLHTKIQSAKIRGVPVPRPKWKTLVVRMIESAARDAANPETIKSALKAYSCIGERTDTGFQYVPAAGISFQGLDANRSCEATLGLAAAFDIPVTIDFFWRDNGKAFDPGGAGRIEYP
ncbi:MAG: hypothetical protein R3D43_06635 [Tepidamorphaceae bacterium]